jgi:hypothetical protein
MSTAQDQQFGTAMPRALEELKGLIRRHYPDAEFAISRSSEEPAIVHLVTVVDVDDTDRVLDVVIDRQIELQIEGLPVFVVTERPPKRAMAMREAARAEKLPGAPTAGP